MNSKPKEQTIRTLMKGDLNEIHHTKQLQVAIANKLKNHLLTAGDNQTSNPGRIDKFPTSRSTNYGGTASTDGGSAA